MKKSQKLILVLFTGVLGFMLSSGGHPVMAGLVTRPATVQTLTAKQQATARQRIPQKFRGTYWSWNEYKQYYNRIVVTKRGFKYGYISKKSGKFVQTHKLFGKKLYVKVSNHKQTLTLRSLRGNKLKSPDTNYQLKKVGKQTIFKFANDKAYRSSSSSYLRTRTHKQRPQVANVNDLKKRAFQNSPFQSFTRLQFDKRLQHLKVLSWSLDSGIVQNFAIKAVTTFGNQYRLTLNDGRADTTLVLKKVSPTTLRVQSYSKTGSAFTSFIKQSYFVASRAYA